MGFIFIDKGYLVNVSFIKDIRYFETESFPSLGYLATSLTIDFNEFKSSFQKNIVCKIEDEDVKDQEDLKLHYRCILAQLGQISWDEELKMYFKKNF